MSGTMATVQALLDRLMDGEGQILGARLGGLRGST